MFSWFKKPAAPPATSARNSFFSTDPELMEKVYADWSAILSLSFQRTASDLKAVGFDGSDAGLKAKFAELRATPGSFAMDSPSAGNPLSMKPLLEPVNNVPITQLAWYASQGFLGWQICAMLAQQWLINRACTMPGRDAMRHGYELATTGGDKLSPDQVKQIRKLDKKYKVRKNCMEMVKFARVFGIRIVMFKIETNNAKFYEDPFNIDAVKPNSYLGISQIDPYWVSPVLDAQAMADPSSIHFYEPTWWVINGRRIHRTHLIIMRNSDVADILKPTYMFGGIPVPQMIAERVYASERTANEAPMLALTKRLYTQKMDLTAAVMNQAQLQERLNFQNAMRDNYGTLAIGLDDEVSQLDTTLTDLDQVIMTQYRLVAAAAGVPASKLLGESPKGGLGSEGEHDADSYHEELETIQENDITPLLERHYELLAKSEGMPEVEFTWNAVDSPSAKEQAELNKSKADTGSVLVASGAIDGTDERNRIIADKDSGYTGIEPVVPGGPGDREAEQERRDQELENAEGGNGNDDE